MRLSRRESFEYPFSKGWVYASGLMTVLSVIFGVFMLSEEGLFALLLYLAFTSLLTVVVLALKFYLYSLRGREASETPPVEMEGEPPRRRWRWSLILILCLAIAALFVPLILLMVLEPLWWLIAIVSYVPAVNIPEIILYFYSRRSSR